MADSNSNHVEVLDQTHGLAEIARGMLERREDPDKVYEIVAGIELLTRQALLAVDDAKTSAA
jgi:hypothetical protein